MNKGPQTNFDERAASWDDDPGRVRLASDVAAAILREAPVPADSDALELGCGSGLVTLRIQPHVRSIVGVDGSRGMLDVLEAKVLREGFTNVVTQLVDLERGAVLDGRFHLVLSSMMLHHIADPGELIRQLAGLLHPGGTLAIADLDSEDGSFHADNTGVRHFGFARAAVVRFFEEAGLVDVHATTATTVTKEREVRRDYSLFLVTGKKPRRQGS